jgi:poly(3-hydroxybutyrate) depolymerase
VAPAQLFATEHLVGTSAHDIHTEMVPGHHLGLFIGQKILGEHWPRAARWLRGGEPPALSARRH